MLIFVAIILFLVGGALIPSDKYTSYNTGVGTIILAIALIVAGFAAMFVYFAVEDDKCSAKGGTYLAREGKCIDVKEVP